MDARVKPAHDALWQLTVARARSGEVTIVYLQPTAEAHTLGGLKRGCIGSRWGNEVSDAAGGTALSTFLQRWWSSERSRWVVVVLLVLFLIGCAFVVRSLGGAAVRGSSAEASIEENWIRTIKNLGVNPIFPPEEDLVVGDVLAVVVGDVDIDSHEQTNAIAKRALITRAVKLAHVDEVKDELDLAYGGLPVF